MAMKGNAMLSGLIGLGVAAVILAIMAPLIQTAFVTPVSSTFGVDESLNLTAINGTTVTLENGGHEDLRSVSISNNTVTLTPVTDYTVNTAAETVAFHIVGAGKIAKASVGESYTTTGTWSDSGYQTNAVNRTLAPFVLAMLFVAVIAMIAIAYL